MGMRSVGFGKIKFAGWRWMTLAALALAIGACGGGPPPRAAFPELTFSHLGQINFDAGRLAVINEYTSPLKAPNVEHEMHLRPATAAIRWAHDRLRVSPNRKKSVLQFVIKSAKVVETELPRQPGMQGFFSYRQSQRYDAELEVLLELLSGSGARLAYATATATRSVTVAENATLNERDQVLYSLVEQLMAELNAELEKNIRQHMSDYIR